MSKILIVNAGSSSLKFKLFEMPAETVLADGEIERINLPGSIIKIKYGDHQEFKETQDNITYQSSAHLMLTELKNIGIIQHLSDIDAIGNRIVAGDHIFSKTTKIDQSIVEKIESLGEIAPIHNPIEAKYIRIIHTILPQVAQYAIFDSVFFRDIPEINAIYSIPYDLTKKYHIQRYGEHGISHGYLTQQASEILKSDQLKLVTLHLGSGASIAAEINGKCFDTSMGFTPMNGVTMGTRSGNVDPSLVPYFMKRLNLSAEGVIKMFNEQSGLLGISGKSSDMRDLESTDDRQAKLALDIFVNRVVKYTAGYIAELNGADAIVFSGGIGEHDEWVRQEVCDRLAYLGVEIDTDLNHQQQPGHLETANSKIKILLIPTNEELAMVRSVQANQ